MPFDILVSPSALEDLNALKVTLRAKVRDALEQYLRHEPTGESKSRIKRLRGLSRPQYRLRVEDIRVYYDVDEDEMTVEVLAIVPKSASEAWLAQEGEANETDSPL